MALRRLTLAVAALASSSTALYRNGSVIAPCDSELFCHGEILQAIELAKPFSDSKTFVDMPTRKPIEEVVAAFKRLQKPLSNNTELNNFLSENFLPAGGELERVSTSQLATNASFMNKLTDAVVNEFMGAVLNIWPDLTRRYVGVSNCTTCVSSAIPLNRTFVVAGGRFREVYYWDSYWIMQGLLRTGGAFMEISKNTIENFLDVVERFGFVPNGMRQYYLNRSQPPLLTQMVKDYVDMTKDTAILQRALPLLIREHNFWVNNRSVNITSPSGKTYTLHQYRVENTQPRPESFYEDYIQANNRSYYSASGIVYPEAQPLNDSEKALLFTNLASGAESGWDYSSRWLRQPNDTAKDVYFNLRSLNNFNIVPVCLNSILYANERTIGEFLNMTGNTTAANTYFDAARARSEAMYDLMWNDTLSSYFDYNLTSNRQRQHTPVDDDATPEELATAPPGYQVIFHVAQFYPFWTGAAPEQLRHNPLAIQKAYARVKAMLDRKAGGIPATNFRSGQQWDQPNVWPPMQWILMKGLMDSPPTFGQNDPAWTDNQALALRIAQRYLDSAFCTWYATGGSTSQTPKLQGAPESAKGTIFEKYADNATDVAGGGGEYKVVEGFGWSNGVLIWAADTFGAQLKRPDCGNITAARVTPAKKRSVERRAVELDPWDAAWTKH